jgi:hypothetical protein
VNEVVAELEIVKKTNYDIQNSSIDSLLYTKEVEIISIRKSYIKNYLQNAMN